MYKYACVNVCQCRTMRMCMSLQVQSIFLCVCPSHSLPGPLKERSSLAGSSSWRFWRPACSWWGRTPSTCCATSPRRSRSSPLCTACGSTSRWGWRTCRRRTTSRSCSRRRSFRRGTCRCHGRTWRRTSGRGWSACLSWWRFQQSH